MKDEGSLFDKINNWIQNSISIKLATIAILALILLIPSAMIIAIIEEREQLNNEAVAEVSSKWANNQLINGPILTVPLVYEKEQNGEKMNVTKYLHVLPESLQINGEVQPEKLNRGIYEVVVYTSTLLVKGNFKLDQNINPDGLKEIHHHKAFLTIGISDLRGIKNEVNLIWDEQTLPVEPGSRISNLVHSGITIDLPDIFGSTDQSIPFQVDLDLQGSQNLSFVPAGNTTTVEMSSTWNSPSFNGYFLPDHREVGTEGFSAQWKVLQLNRNFPQSWIGSEQLVNMDSASFGFDLLVTLDDYQKSIRSAKYAIMTIALTFLIFFLVEILNNRKIHPFQYALVGLALCLFYTLLVSITEHSNFNFAYAISTLAIVLMIGLYSTTVFKSVKLSLLLVVALIAAYGFMFVTLQLSDYALLLGSVGLTLILAATMYLTRNVNWYSMGLEPN